MESIKTCEPIKICLYLPSLLGRKAVRHSTLMHTRAARISRCEPWLMIAEYICEGHESRLARSLAAAAPYRLAALPRSGACPQPCGAKSMTFVTFHGKTVSNQQNPVRSSVKDALQCYAARIPPRTPASISGPDGDGYEVE